jgi:predicted HTH domain antitoxin
MPQIAIDYPDELLVGLGTSADAFEKEARFALAAKLYEQGRLSSGKAAGIAGLDPVTFLLRSPDKTVFLRNTIVADHAKADGGSG